MRQRESLDELERRMLGAVHEIQQAKAYDYLLINDRFEEAVQEMVHIVQAQRIKMRSKETLIQNVLNPDTVV
jgi:guanylate kinase